MRPLGQIFKANLARAVHQAGARAPAAVARRGQAAPGDGCHRDFPQNCNGLSVSLGAPMSRQRIRATTPGKGA